MVGMFIPVVIEQSPGGESSPVILQDPVAPPALHLVDRLVDTKEPAIDVTVAGVQVEPETDLVYLCPDPDVLTQECIAELDRRYLYQPVSAFKAGRGPGTSLPGLAAPTLGDLLATNPQDVFNAGQMLTEQRCIPEAHSLHPITGCDPTGLARTATLTRLCANRVPEPPQAGSASESQAAFWARAQAEREDVLRVSWLRHRCEAVTLAAPAEPASELNMDVRGGLQAGSGLRASDAIIVSNAMLGVAARLGDRWSQALVDGDAAFVAALEETDPIHAALHRAHVEARAIHNQFLTSRLEVDRVMMASRAELLAAATQSAGSALGAALMDGESEEAFIDRVLLEAGYAAFDSETDRTQYIGYLTSVREELQMLEEVRKEEFDELEATAAEQARTRMLLHLVHARDAAVAAGEPFDDARLFSVLPDLTAEEIEAALSQREGTH